VTAITSPDKAAVTRRRRLRFLGDFPSRDADRPHSLIGAFTAVALVGVLGGMIGLGGAEFRLPLLIGLFGFVALQAVVLNEAMSLLVVLTALPARLSSVPWSSLSPHWFVAVNLLAGSLVGAWVGATWATRMRSATLYRVLAVLLVLVAAALAWSHSGHVGALDLPPAVRLVAGAVIGIVAALMGVAGGELLIPTIVLLYGWISRSRAACPWPCRYRRCWSPSPATAAMPVSPCSASNAPFVLAVAAGSIAGTALEDSSSASCPMSS
jgi:uncharacterized protein